MITLQRKDWSELYSSVEPPVPGDFNPDLFDPEETGEDEED
jgi:hypothetical protein